MKSIFFFTDDEKNMVLKKRCKTESAGDNLLSIVAFLFVCMIVMIQQKF